MPKINTALPAMQSQDEMLAGRVNGYRAL